MGQRLGAFKTKQSQLVIWENNGKLSFEFAKHFKDKQTQQWKQTKVLYAEELRDIGEMFLRAATWVANKNKLAPLPQGMSTLKDVATQIIETLGGKSESTSKDV